MKIFITGSTGLVGKDMVPVLAKEHELFILSGRLENIDDFKDTLNKCDIILHIVGTANPKESMRVNYELTNKLLSVCRKTQKFVYISSFHATFKNKNKYALSKIKAEKAVQKSGLDYLIFRPTLLYNKKGEFYIAKLIKQTLKLPFAIQPGNGNYFLQPLLTNDFAKIVLAGLKNIKNQIIPVAGKDAISIKELINLIILQTKAKPVIPVPLWLLKIFGPLAGINRDKIKELSEDKTMDIKNVEDKFNITLHSIREMLPNIIAHVKTAKKTVS